MGSFLPKPWKLLESAPTSTLSRPSVRILSISVCESILSTSSESTRCCRALELIDSRLVCEAPAREALRRAKFKFPGRQKIFLSKKFGFTKFDRADFEEGIKDGSIVPDGVTCQYRPNHGP